MHRNKGKPVIKWLELAGATREQKEGAVAAVHTVDLDEHQPCFGVTLDQRWLCGSDGALTFFDSMAAASRFMRLLNVERLAKGGGSSDCGVTRQDAFQCFQLGAEGIATCNKCRFGEDARSHSSREHARSEERW